MPRAPQWLASPLPAGHERQIGLMQERRSYQPFRLTRPWSPLDLRALLPRPAPRATMTVAMRLAATATLPLMASDRPLRTTMSCGIPMSETVTWKLAAASDGSPVAARAAQR